MLTKQEKATIAATVVSEIVKQLAIGAIWLLVGLFALLQVTGAAMDKAERDCVKDVAACSARVEARR